MLREQTSSRWISNVTYACQGLGHETRLRGNPRLRVVLASLRKRSGSRHQTDRAIYQLVKETLISGEVLTPKKLL